MYTCFYFTKLLTRKLLYRCVFVRFSRYIGFKIITGAGSRLIIKSIIHLCLCFIYGAIAYKGHCMNFVIIF